MGCYINDGVNRNNGHLLNDNSDKKSFLTIDECANKSPKFFGVEYPQSSDKKDSAECLLLSEIPQNEKTNYKDCAFKLDSKGRRLGNKFRLTVYSKNDSKNSEFIIKNGVVAFRVDSTSR